MIEIPRPVNQTSGKVRFSFCDLGSAVAAADSKKDSHQPNNREGRRFRNDDKANIVNPRIARR